MTYRSDIVSDVKTKTQELRDDTVEAVRADASAKADALRDRAVDEVDAVANAAGAAAAQFDPNSLQAQAASQIAGHVEGLAAQLRDADLGSMTRDVSNFARQNPALFLGGAALIGFAATRFLKARDPQRVEPDMADQDAWGATSTYGEHS